MNTYILTNGGITGLLNTKPFSVTKEHAQYEAIAKAALSKNWAQVEALLNPAAAVESFVKELNSVGGDVQVEIKGNDVIVTYRGLDVNAGELGSTIRSMVRVGYDVSHLLNLLDRLMKNPDPNVISRVFDFITTSGMPITEDGHIIAYKRVNDNYRSFYDDSTEHVIGGIVKMDRKACNPNGAETCSHGLHFCSHSYLSHWYGNQGRVLILKIDPINIVSIPNDYNDAKGRACEYLVLAELEGEARLMAETEAVFKASDKAVVSDIDIKTVAKYGPGQEALAPFDMGYKHGKQKMRRVFPSDPVERAEYESGYNYAREERKTGKALTKLSTRESYSLGYEDGRQKYKSGGAGVTTLTFTTGSLIVQTEPYLLGYKDGRGHKARQY